MSKLGDAATPAAMDFVLTNGKKAKIGTITLGILVKIEAKYGSFEEWQKTLTDPKKSVTGKFHAMAEMLWMLCINKEEIVPSNRNKDEEQRMLAFLELFPLSNIGGVMEFLSGIMAGAMPVAKQGGKKKTGKKKATAKKVTKKKAARKRK